MRAILRLVFVLVLVLVCLAAWVGVRGWLAKDHLQTSADLVQRLQTQLEQGSTVPARTTVTNLQNETADAMRLTDDRVWRAAQHLPGVGDDMAAVHAVSLAGHTLSTDALPSIATAAADVHRLRNRGGDATPAELATVARRLKTPLATAQAGVAQAQEQIAAVDPATLFAPVRSGVQEFSSGLDTLSAELASLVAANNAVLKAAGVAGLRPEPEAVGKHPGAWDAGPIVSIDSSPESSTETSPYAGPGASPLLARPGAVAAEGADAGVAWHYGDPMLEQRRLAEGVGVVDLSHRGVVTVTGPDRLSWLHSLTTQHLTGLAPTPHRGAGPVPARPRRARPAPGRRRRDDLAHVEPGTAPRWSAGWTRCGSCCGSRSPT